MKNGGNFKIGSFELPRPIAFAYLLSILYNVTFFMQFSVIPYLTKHLNLSDSDFGYVQTLGGIFQMIGGPIYGYIIQRFGLHKALLLCYTSTMISGIAMYFCTDYYTLLLTKIPALFMHGQQAHQTLLSALTKPGKERTSAFGRMGLTFGIGFIFVPIFSILATSITKSDLSPLLLSSFLCILPCLILEHCIDKSVYENVKEDGKTSEDQPQITIQNVVRILGRPGIVNVLIKKNAPIIPFLLMIAVLNIHIIDKFDASNAENQMLQMMMGIFIMFSNGFGVIWLRKKFEEQHLLIIGAGSFLIGYILFATILTSFWMLAIIMPFISMGTSIVATCSDSLLTSLVEESEQGLVLGAATSLNSLVRTFSPLFAGNLRQNYGFVSIPIIGMMGSLLLIVLSITIPVDEKLIRKQKAE